MIHPAFAIDLEAASARFHASLFGGDYWDELAVAMRPDFKQIGDEHLDSTFDACIDNDLAEDGDRTRVVSGKSVSVRVDLGGRRFIKKKQTNTNYTRR